MYFTDLCGVGKVAELCFPQYERVGVLRCGECSEVELSESKYPIGRFFCIEVYSFLCPRGQYGKVERRGTNFHSTFPYWSCLNALSTNT